MAAGGARAHPSDQKSGGPMITRVLYATYGRLAYMLFLTIFLYAVTFIGGFAVETMRDGTATAPFPTALGVDVASEPSAICW
jgi:hypothetical protein